MKIAMSSGHGKYIRGASGYPVPPQLDEVDEARKVVDRTAELLRQAGIECVTFHDDVSDSQSENLDRIVDWHNDQTRDLDCSVHFNAFDGSAHGVEVLYVTQQTLASTMSSAIAAAGHFTNRGAKYRSDLAFLNGTEQPAVLVETCFCDHTGDSNNYNQYFDVICEAIAEGLSGREVPEAPGEQPPEPEQPPELPTEDNRVDILGRTEGDVTVIINNTRISGTERCRNVVRMRIGLTGDVVLSINGEEFHNNDESMPPEEPQPPASQIPENQRNIITTVFGGAVDNENSAYAPYGYLNDSDLYVALPLRIEGERPLVKVWNRQNGRSSVGEIMDVGPWLTDDEAYVMGDERPLAETCYLAGEPLPRGPNAGKVPNGAGIDISPAMAQVLGISGKGTVDWEFVDDEEG